MSGFLTDLRFAWRSLRARRSTTIFAVLTLACGLGAAVAIGCVVDAVLLRALPYAQPDQIVQIHERAKDGHGMALAMPNYQDFASSQTGFSAVAYYTGFAGPIANGTQVLRDGIGTVGGDFFRLFGVVPAQGRLFGADEREHVVIVAHAFWQGALQGRADVLGQPLDVGGERYTIVGVLPAQFGFPASTSAWVPDLEPPGTSRSAHNWQALGRLRAAGELAATRQSADALGARIKQQYGDEVDATGFVLTPLRDAIAAPARSALLMLALGTGFLLLIAVTNTTNLLLALNGARTRELAVRKALGASDARLVRQILIECATIAGAAWLLGMALAAVALRVLAHSGAANLPRIDEIRLDAGVVGSGAVATLLIAVVVAGAVWWNSRRHNVVDDLRESGRSQTPARSHLRARAALLIGQTALTTVLLVGAGLLARSFLALLAVDPGFQAEGAVAVHLSQPWSRDAAVSAARAQRYHELQRTFSTLPGVTAVGGVSGLPLTADGADGGFWDGSVTSFVTPPPKPIGYGEFRAASPDYFKAARIPLLRGRVFDATDLPDGAPVAVVSAALARATWGERDPLGQRIQVGNMDGDERIATVVGVVGDVQEHRLDRAPSGALYVDAEQRPMAAAEFDVVVRSDLPAAVLMAALRTSLDRNANGIPYSLRPLSEVRASALAERRLSLVLLGAFAAIAFVLAVGGLYGLMAFAVGQRVHEFALRQALGATRRIIARSVLGSGLRIGTAGVVLGLLASVIAARAAGNLLYGVGAADPLTLVGVSVLLLATLAAACLQPALRACSVMPREALS